MLKFLFLCLLMATSVASANAFRIVGGIAADIKQTPFIVSLRDGTGGHYCGGTLVNTEWVVTAAHCIVMSGEPSVLFADSSSAIREHDTKILKVIEVYVHPNFNKDVDNGSDIALIKIESFPAAKVAIINEQDIINYSHAPMQVAGWGNQSEWGNSADKLQIVDVPYVDSLVCEAQFQKQFPSSSSHLDNTMFCAGYEDGKKDACQGDSGGPIFTYDMDRKDYILLGVVSWGSGCARPNLSGVYTNISQMNAWVQETMKQNL